MPSEVLKPDETILNDPNWLITGASSVHEAINEGMASKSAAENVRAGKSGRIFRVKFPPMQSANVGEIYQIDVPFYYTGIIFTQSPVNIIRLRKVDLSLIAEERLDWNTNGAPLTGQNIFSGLSLVQSDIDDGFILEYESDDTTGGAGRPPDVYG